MKKHPIHPLPSGQHALFSWQEPLHFADRSCPEYSRTFTKEEYLTLRQALKKIRYGPVPWLDETGIS